MNTVLRIALVFALAGGFAQTTLGQEVIAAGAKLEKLAGDFKFTEGPASDKAGNVFFTDQPNDRIMK